MRTDFLMRQAMQTKRWKDERLSISQVKNQDSGKMPDPEDQNQKIESHMTFHLESKNQNPGTVRQDGVSRMQKE